MELKKIIGQKIRELRKGRGMTQAELAAVPELGISQASLAAYEIGAREPGMETIAAIAHFFHVTIDSLFGETVRPEGAGLSDQALDFLAVCDAELLDMVDAVLASETATDFFEDLRTYVLGSHISPEDLARDLVDLDPMAARINRSPSKSLIEARAEERLVYLKHILDRDLNGLCDELALRAAEQLAEDYTAGADQGDHYEKEEK